MTEPRIRKRKITEYLPDDANANQGSERGLQMLEDSLREVGVGRSLVADAHDRIPAGNKTMEAAINAGIEDVIEIETDGHALIVHKRRDWDLDDQQGAARSYAYRDNRIGQVSLNWDANQIAQDVESGVDLSGMFTPGELNAIISVPDLNSDFVNIPEQFMILIECASERAQSQLLERLTDEGLKCRALIS